MLRIFSGPKLLMFNDPRESEEQFKDLYHSTDHESAVDILNGRSIHLPAGRQKRDFSSGKGST